MMTQRMILRAPEDEGGGGQGLGAAIAAAGESAVARVAAENASPSQEQYSAEPQTAEPQATAPASTPEASAYELNYEGRTHKMNKAELDYIVRFGVDAYKQALRAQQEQSQPEAEKPPLDDIERKVQELVDQRTKPLSEKLSAMEREKAMAELVKEADGAMGKHKIFERLGANPRLGQKMKGVVMYIKGCNPGMSFDAVAQELAGELEEAWSTEKAQYVQEKISAAGKRVEGSGGSPPAPGPKKLGAKEFANGGVFNAALERATRAAMER